MHISDITVFGWFHSVTCMIALLCGAANLALPKGTGRHRVAGRIYVWSMIALNLSAFAIYRFDIGQFVPFRAGAHVFGFFHWLAVTTIVLVLIGYHAGARQGRTFWAYVHPTAMVLSYYVLIGGGINEAFARIDFLRAMAIRSGGGAGFGRAPIIGLTHTAAMAAALVLVLYFFVKVALYRRREAR